ncbi:MAG: hypothetical protein ACRD1E_01685, partial [Terriglobales bacterium]
MQRHQLQSLLCVALCLVWLLPAPAQQAAKPQAPIKFTSDVNVVLVNLTVRDSKGNLVTDLKPSEVTLLEDGKPQHINSFDFENVDAGANASAAGTADRGPAGTI